MKPLVLSNFTASSCIGLGLDETRESLRAHRSGLKPCDFETVDIDTHIGEVAGVDAVQLPAELSSFDCRNNRLAELALRQDGCMEAVVRAASRYGRKRIGVFMGTSTAGILQTELAYRRRDPVSGALPDSFVYSGTHNSFSVADYLRRRLGLEGPAVAVSCACASSAKVFGSARRMIDAGIIDAALVGGVDSLCLTTLYGFRSLQLSSSRPCRPFDVTRDGISIGEAAAFALLERPTEQMSGDDILLLGVGESSDAYHMSAPHPEGAGAISAMRQALRSARLAPSQIDWVNLHGTGTRANDAMEDGAVASVFGPATPCSSIKGWSGHTLGACGILAAVIAGQCMAHGFLPGCLGVETVDPAFRARVLTANEDHPVRRVALNAFGFGGVNCCLILGAA